MILAAGRGQRMRPLSDVIPKPALPLKEGPVVSWPLRLAAAACRRVVVNTWHLAEQMEAAVHACSSSAEVLISREPQLMGTAGGLALARRRRLLDDGPVLVINGDSLFHLDLGPLCERHLGSDDLITLALLPHLDPRAWSRVLLDSNGRVAQILPPGDPEPGEAPFLYPGVMLVGAEALAEVPVAPADTWDRLWQPAMAQNRLGGAVVGGYWREVGNPGAYLDTVIAQLDDQPQIAADATVAGNAAIGTALIGPGASIEARSVVAESVVSHGAVVHQGARVIRSVLLGAARAEPDEVVVGTFRAIPGVASHE
jgi:mannose-1-phosphate guanylyltransferase